jgi:release factor glutamine methyltransferase
VTPDVLIPRLETEVLVKRARNILHDEKREGIIDIGTGSGIIPVSLRDFTE